MVTSLLALAYIVLAGLTAYTFRRSRNPWLIPVLFVVGAALIALMGPR